MKLYMRVQGDREMCVGSAASMLDVPALLRDLADRWEVKHLDDAVYLFAGQREGRARVIHPDPAPVER